ncbi:MAG: hypothetical protein AB7V42_05155 [Thermoleophilia bacterium]
MAYDDEDDWPKPRHDPESEEIVRERLRSTAEVRRRVLRWVYAGLGVLLIVVLVLAYTR